MTLTGARDYLACPACAPTPDDKPHDYKPVDADEAGIVQRAIAACDPRLAYKARATFARNNVCCLDPGDCSGPCGLA